MVSENQNPTDKFFVDPTGMALTELGALAAGAPTPLTIASPAEDPNKKIRKPYTITKSRQSWTEPEHDKFLEALQLFDRDWKKIEAFIGSKTVIQIRSHAQKYFMKVQKNGTSEHLPPPRPKRKSAHPYPQKAPKNAAVPSQLSVSFKSAALLDSWSALRQDSSYMLMNTNAGLAASSWTKSAQTISFSHGSQVAANNCCSSTESTQKQQPVADAPDQGNNGHPLRVLPDFAQVYGFIGSVFDPNATNHLQKLKMMDPIDVETVVLLMRNLSINLTSPDFEDHKRLLSSYEIDADTNDCGVTVECFSDDHQSKHVP